MHLPKNILPVLCHPLLFAAVLVLTQAVTVNAAEGSIVSRPIVATPSDWIQPLFFDRLPPSAKLDPGENQRWLLYERQVHAGKNETFIHVVRQIRTLSGVQEGANLSIEFDPGYHTLVLHWIRIWRGTNFLNRLDIEKVRLVQRERGLDQQLLSGKQSAVLVLDDVRVGDIVDYSYSIQGHNPVFSGNFSASLPLQFPEPLERLRMRVIWPKSRGQLHVKNHGTSTRAKAVQTQDAMEYTWDLQRVAAQPLEDSLPSWFNPLPWVQLTEFKSWAEVNQWAVPLFQNTSETTPDLIQKIKQWQGITSPEQKILSALRFVQDEVRYFGIEIGESSHKPSDPSTVFTRRFGDCKDKALLFVSILRMLGIEAHPVLVNTDARHTIENWLPTATAFDHCIASVRMNGRTYWVDPTATYQRGSSLAAQYLPHYGRGLVVAPGTKSLTVIPPSMGVSETRIVEYFQLRGKNEPADLRVVTTAEGRDADTLRAYFGSNPRSEIEKTYLRFYARAYSRVRQTEPLVFTDDEQLNRIVISEFYSLDQPWTASDNGRYRFEVFPSQTASVLRKPADIERRMPIALTFPLHHIWRAEVNLPAGWLPEVRERTVNDPAFFFRQDYRCLGGSLELECEYESRAEIVPVRATAAYLDRLDEASQQLGYFVIWP